MRTAQYNSSQAYSSLQFVRRLFVATFMIGFCGITAASAQIDVPAPSPTGKVEQKVGLTNVSVVYSRPSVKGRTIFGDLVPYGKLWRTGANACTKITLGDEAMIGGKKVPAGEYSLFTIPGKKQWTVIFNKNTKLWGTGGYNESEDVAHIMVHSMELEKSVESFTIMFANIKTNSAELHLKWANTAISIPIEVEVDKKVMAQIKMKIAMIDKEKDPAGVYAAAAYYYYDTDRDMKQALTWIDKSISMDKEKKFWILHRKALIQQKLSDKAGAIKTAEESRDLAAKAKNAGYVKMNEKLIAELKK
jgi:hypothetical protein